MGVNTCWKPFFAKGGLQWLPSALSKWILLDIDLHVNTLVYYLKCAPSLLSLIYCIFSCRCELKLLEVCNLQLQWRCPVWKNVWCCGEVNVAVSVLEEVTCTYMYEANGIMVYLLYACFRLSPALGFSHLGYKHTLPCLLEPFHALVVSDLRHKKQFCWYTLYGRVLWV